MAQYKLHKVLALPATPEANAIYFVKEGTTEFKIYVTDSSGAIKSLNGTSGNRTIKTVSNISQYTVVAADYTDHILYFDADTSGANINVLLNADVSPDLNSELIIYSGANHVLNFTGGTGVTLKTTAGNLFKSANDGDSIAILGVRPMGSVNILGVYGTLEFNTAPDEEVLLYSSLSTFPVNGVDNIIYVAKDTRKLYLWTGAAYGEIGDGTGEVNNVVFVNDVSSLPTTGVVDTLYITKSENTLYEWNGTAYNELSKQRIVSINGGNYITEGSDGGAFYDALIARQSVEDAAFDSAYYLHNIADDLSDLATRADAAPATAQIFLWQTLSGSLGLAIDLVNTGFDPTGMQVVVRLGSYYGDTTPYFVNFKAENGLTLGGTYGTYTSFTSSRSFNMSGLTGDSEAFAYFKPMKLSTGGGTSEPVTVVSTDTGNDITTGGDGGAFFTETPNVSSDVNNSITTGGDGGAYFEYDTTALKTVSEQSAFKNCYYLHDVADDFSDLEARADAHLAIEMFLFKTISGNIGIAVKNTQPYNLEGLQGSAALTTVGQNGLGLTNNIVYWRDGFSTPWAVGTYNRYTNLPIQSNMGSVSADSPCFIWLKPTSNSSSGTSEPVTVVSTDVNNDITSGNDGGAYLDLTGFGGEVNNVEFYTSTTAFPTTGVVDILYVAKTETSAYIWDGSAYQLVGDSTSTSNVEFYADVASLPATGTADILYISKAENSLHEWNGTSYDTLGGETNSSSEVEIVSSLPATGVVDTIYARTTDNTIHRWDGATYVQLGGSTGLTESDIVNTSREYNNQQNQSQKTLTDATTISWNLDTQQSAYLLATSTVGNIRTLPNSILTAGVNGGNYQLVFQQDATGGRSINFDTNFDVVGAFDLRPNEISIVLLNIQSGVGRVVITSWEGITTGLSNAGAGNYLLLNNTIKSLVAGTNMTITATDTEVTFDAAGGGSGGQTHHIASVSSFGDDTTAVVDDSSKPFATLSAARSALQTLDSGKKGMLGEIRIISSSLDYVFTGDYLGLQNGDMHVTRDSSITNNFTIQLRELLGNQYLSKTNIKITLDINDTLTLTGTPSGESFEMGHLEITCGTINLQAVSKVFANTGKINVVNLNDTLTANNTFATFRMGCDLNVRSITCTNYCRFIDNERFGYLVVGDIVTSTAGSQALFWLGSGGTIELSNTNHRATAVGSTLGTLIARGRDHSKITGNMRGCTMNERVFQIAKGCVIHNFSISSFHTNVVTTSSTAALFEAYTGSFNTGEGNKFKNISVYGIPAGTLINQASGYENIGNWALCEFHGSNYISKTDGTDIIGGGIVRIELYGHIYAHGTLSNITVHGNTTYPMKTNTFS